MKRRNILIIKTGHAEVFNESTSSSVCSLGDVLRSTFILHYFKDDNVYWLTDKKAFGLFENKKMLIGLEEFSEIKFEEFDIILNLEKDIFITDKLSDFDNTYGFLNKQEKLVFSTFPKKELISFSKLEKEVSESDNKKFQHHLGLLLNEVWKVEDYVFRKSNRKCNSARVGLNWQVGSKWPEKELDRLFWEELEKIISLNYEVSWQQGFDNLEEYISWIDSCDYIITLDSLGLHISLALKKQVLALFGPTNASEVEMFDRGEKFFYEQNLSQKVEKREKLIQEILNSLKK